MYTASRFHDISCGHRVVGHEGKCRHLHGHNYRVHFHCRPSGMVVLDRTVLRRTLDDIGRVIDFSVIKDRLCMWLEDHWDHKFLMWEKDEHIETLLCVDGCVVRLPFNPTAENLAQHLVNVVGPIALENTGVELYRVDIEETAKCSASYQKDT